MLYYLLTALVASVTGAVCMKIIQEFLKREERKRIVSEKPYFKYNYLRYYVRKMSDGVLEFWAFPTMGVYDGCIGREWTWELEQFGVNSGFYLGKVVDGEVQKPVNFYSLPMQIQRGAIRLYTEAGYYEG